MFKGERDNVRRWKENDRYDVNIALALVVFLFVCTPQFIKFVTV